MPAGYAPFGIQDLNNLIYVTYAKQDAQKHDDVAGPGHGFIDVYTPDGFLVERLASRGTLNAPWGMAIAPSSFGRLVGMLLVGNFGDGRINVFNPFTPNRFLGQLKDQQGRAITIQDLWALTVGTASTGGTGTVLFSAASTTRTTACLVPSTRPARRACQVRLRCCLAFMDSNAAARVDAAGGPWHWCRPTVCRTGPPAPR